jgi:hypothetical protein
MSSDVHDRVRAETRNPWIIGLASENQNVSVSAEIRGTESKVDSTIGLRWNNSQFARSATQTERRNRADSEAPAQLVIPFKSPAKGALKPRVKAQILLRALSLDEGFEGDANFGQLEC